MLRPISLIALVACFTARAVKAQDAGNRARVWAAIGVGGSAPASGGEGITNMVQLVYQKTPHHAAIRGLILHDIDRNTNEIGEVGILYGRTRSLPWARVAVATGISEVGFSACPDDDDSCFTGGIPIVAEASRSGRFFGVGLQAFANVNGKAHYAGAVLFLQLGRLR